MSEEILASRGVGAPGRAAAGLAQPQFPYGIAPDVGGELTFPSLSVATIDHVAEPVVRGNGPGTVASKEPPLKVIGSSVGLVSPGSVSETVTDETPAIAVTLAAKAAGWLGRQVGTVDTATDGGGLPSR